MQFAHDRASEGGYTVWGKLVPARRSLAEGALPIGLAHGVVLNTGVGRGAIVRQSDVTLASSPALELRHRMETGLTFR